MALKNLTLTNEEWWAVSDALHAFEPADDALANVVETAIPARGTTPTGTTTINGVTDASQASLLARMVWAPFFGCKGALTSLLRQGMGT